MEERRNALRRFILDANAGLFGAPVIWFRKLPDANPGDLRFDADFMSEIEAAAETGRKPE
jgi:hypothetical protein